MALRLLAIGDVSFNQEVYLLDTGFSIPGSHIGPGTNQYVFTGDHQPSSGGAYQFGSFTLLDWIDVDYAKRYVARNDRLDFTSFRIGIDLCLYLVQHLHRQVAFIVCWAAQGGEH